MTDHLHEALTLIDPDQMVDGDAALAQVHATLEVAEHVEYAGEQLRRIADAVEQVVEAWRRPSGILTVPGPLAPEDVERIRAAVPGMRVVVAADGTAP